MSIAYLDHVSAQSGGYHKRGNPYCAFGMAKQKFLIGISNIHPYLLIFKSRGTFKDYTYSILSSTYWKTLYYSTTFHTIVSCYK